MASWLADTQAIALATGRRPSTIRSWAHRYPGRLPRRGTGEHGRALYSVRDARKLAASLAAVENPVTMCNTEPSAGACPETGDLVAMAGPRYKVIDGVTVCEDCGVVVAIREAHTRFHSISSSWAWALAVLKTSHIAAHVHDRYDVVERIDSRKFDNWSVDALAEVMAAMPDGAPD